MFQQKILEIYKMVSGLTPLPNSTATVKEGIEKPCQKLLELASRITRAKQAALFHVDRKIGAQWLLASLGEQGVPSLYWDAAQEVALNPQPLFFRPNDQPPCPPILAIPLDLRNNFFGVLLVGGMEGPPLTPEDLNLLTLLAEVVSESLALHTYQLESVKALVKALEARDPYTGQHSTRVTEISLRFARYLKLSAEDLESLETGCFLHDVGKVGINDNLLLKPGTLTAEEWAVIQTHPLIGGKIVEPLNLRPQEVKLIMHHHERWDGGGYPHGLYREEIPPLCTILALADCFDALTTDRPYRRGRPVMEAIQEIQASAGKQFDPHLTSEFVEMVSLENRYNSYLFSQKGVA